MSNYEITNNENDKINSTVLYTHFVSRCRDSKISNKRFKDDILGISGISTKRSNKGVLFTGLKLKEDIDNDDDE
jgi:hypothetical protein